MRCSIVCVSDDKFLAVVHVMMTRAVVAREHWSSGAVVIGEGCGDEADKDK